MSWEPVIRSISAEVTARPRRSGPAALQRTSTARRSGSGAREFYGFWGHLGPDPRIRAGKDECAGSPWRSRARTPKIRALTLERSMLSPHMRRRAVESSARTRIWVARGRVCHPAEMRERRKGERRARARRGTYSQTGRGQRRRGPRCHRRCTRKTWWKYLSVSRLGVRALRKVTFEAPETWVFRLWFL